MSAGKGVLTESQTNVRTVSSKGEEEKTELSDKYRGEIDSL